MRRRRFPWPPAEDRGRDHGRDWDVTPGGTTPPSGVLPGWDWTPPGGLEVNDADLPWWVRVWRRLPFVDRYAHVWMWHHGGFAFPEPPGQGGDPAGDREPRRPLHPAPSLAQSRSPWSSRARRS